MTACYNLPDKTRVAHSFGKAAENYDRFAHFQRDIADTLIDAIDVSGIQHILDLGSGTGYCGQQLQLRFPEASITNLDIAEAMLEYARSHNRRLQCHWICSDAQALPFRDSSFDLVVSSLTLQWCAQPERFFSELYRVMKPGSRAWVSTLAEQTLAELRASWSTVDDYVHVNRFLFLYEIEDIVASVPFARVNTHNQQQQYYYDSLQALSQELKGIGANNRNVGQARGLTGRHKLQRLKSSFEKNRIAGKGIPVTYDLVMICLEK